MTNLPVETRKGLPNIRGLREVVAGLERERDGWLAAAAARPFDRDSRGDAERISQQIEELKTLDPARVARVDLKRNGRGETDVEIVKRPPKIRHVSQAPKKIKTITTRRDASGNLVADVFECDAKPEPQRPAPRQVVVKGEQGAPSPAPDPAGDGAKTSWMNEYDEILGGEGAATKIFDEAFKRANAVYSNIKEKVPAGALHAFVKGLYAENYVLLCVHAARRHALQERIAELEARAVEFCGAWEPDQTYRKGNMVQRKGGLWVALSVTTTEPPGPQWRLMVRGG